MSWTDFELLLLNCYVTMLPHIDLAAEWWVSYLLNGHFCSDLQQSWDISKQFRQSSVIGIKFCIGIMVSLTILDKFPQQNIHLSIFVSHSIHKLWKLEVKQFHLSKNYSLMRPWVQVMQNAWAYQRPWPGVMNDRV